MQFLLCIVTVFYVKEILYFVNFIIFFKNLIRIIFVLSEFWSKKNFVIIKSPYLKLLFQHHYRLVYLKKKFLFVHFYLIILILDWINITVLLFIGFYMKFFIDIIFKVLNLCDCKWYFFWSWIFKNLTNNFRIYIKI